MYNSKRTLEVFGYDLENMKRRSKEELEATGGQIPKNMMVIDNCPSCSVERQVQFRQSRKNKPCSKCHHNSPEMLKTKQNQNKVKSEETKQKMRDSHWSKNGFESPFKGQRHSNRARQVLSKATEDFYQTHSYEEYKNRYIKGSCTQRNIPIEDFNGFSAPENTRIRQSVEGKAWTYDILSKSNFTCTKCSQRGGKLHAHHLNGFNLFPDLRFDLDNGVCLCESCHDKFHEVYGKGDNTKEQFQQWLSLK